MKHLKLIAVTVGLILVVNATAGAVSLPSYAYVWKMTTWDSGTDYTPLGIGSFSTAAGTLPDPTIPQTPGGPIGGPGAQTVGNTVVEDTWGVFRIEQVLLGNISTNDPFTITAGAETWAHGNNGKELIGMFWGMTDIQVVNFADPMSGVVVQAIQSTGMNMIVWEQDAGHFKDPTDFSRGSADRTGPHGYIGVGDDASSVLWLSGITEPGFLGSLLATESIGTYSSDASATIPGGLAAYLSRMDFDLDGNGVIDPYEIGTQSDFMDQDYFTNGLLNPADASLNMTTDLNNPTNTPAGGIHPQFMPDGVTPNPLAGQVQGPFDWTVTNNDDVIGYAIPEPITMLGLFLGIGGLGGYIRKRRQA